MSAFQRGKDAIYRCSAFAEFTWLRHGFGTRVANPVAHVTLRQIHSNVALNATGLQDREFEGDALVTDETSRAVGVRTADCVPILLFDPNKRAVSAIHAGWRGTSAGIVPVTIQKLRGEFDSEPPNLFAAIGPCIRQCCYEVGPDVADRFTGVYSTKSAGLDRWHLDLAGINRKQMIDCGLLPQHVFDIGLCTACEADEFFSFRREPANPGRMISSIERTV